MQPACDHVVTPSTSHIRPLRNTSQRVFLWFVFTVMLTTGCSSKEAPSPSEPAEPVAPPPLEGQLVYVHRITDQDRLFLSNLSYGGDIRELVLQDSADFKSSAILSMGPPVWNPDGTRIALPVGRAEGQSQLLVIDAKTGATQTASRQDQRIYNPDWAPDGKKISYVVEDPTSSRRFIAMTELESGVVTEFTETESLTFSAHRWDQTSSGILIGQRPGQQEYQRLRLDIQTRELTAPGRKYFIAIRNLMDFTPVGAELVRITDPEYVALTISEQTPTDQSSGTIVASSFPYLGIYTAWFLGSFEMIGIEQISSFDRQPPLIAKRDLNRPLQNARYDLIPVDAPTPLKWDFHTDALP